MTTKLFPKEVEFLLSLSLSHQWFFDVYSIAEFWGVGDTTARIIFNRLRSKLISSSHNFGRESFKADKRGNRAVVYVHFEPEEVSKLKKLCQLTKNSGGFDQNGRKNERNTRENQRNTG